MALSQKSLRKNFAGQLISSAAAGFFAGAALAGGLLALDWSGLYSLMAAGPRPYPLMALFIVGFGILLSPASLATGLAVSSREGNRGPYAPFSSHGRERHSDRAGRGSR